MKSAEEFTELRTQIHWSFKMLILILIPLVFFFIWCLQKISDRIKGLPPGPFRFPIIGCLAQILLAHPTLPFVGFEKLAKYYGNVYSVQMGLIRGVSITGYEAVSEVYRNEDCDGRWDEVWQLDRTYGKPLGFISSHVNIWRESRKFTTRGLREYGFGVNRTMESMLQDELVEFSANISDKLKKNDGVISIPQFSQKPVVNVVWCMLTGARFHYDDPRFEEILDTINMYNKSGAFGAGLLSSFPFLRKIFPSALGFETQQKANRNAHRYLEGIIADTRADTQYKTNPKSFIEVFLQKIDTRESTGDLEDVIFSDKNLVSIVYDLLFGASETGSSTLEFGILRMVLNEDIMQKVVQEIDTVIGNRLPSLADREIMIYTEATISEIHRISTVAVIAPRKLETKDATIGKFRVLKGTTLYLNLYTVAMDPDMWGDPHVFRPERFISRDGKLINTEKILPFGAGKRNCIAESLGKATLFILFVGLLQKFSFSLNPNEEKPSTEPVLGFTLSPRPFSVRASSRY